MNRNGLIFKARYFDIGFVMDGPQVRRVSRYAVMTDSSRHCIDIATDASNLVSQPCEPRCEGTTSYCCGLTEVFMTELSLGCSGGIYAAVKDGIAKNN